MKISLVFEASVLRPRVGLLTYLSEMLSMGLNDKFRPSVSGFECRPGTGKGVAAIEQMAHTPSHVVAKMVM